MNEQAARQVTLVRAVEEADAERQILSDDDRLYATRSALELARWEVADRKSAFTPALFLQKRAEQLLLKLAERHPALTRITSPSAWPRLALFALPLLAFLTGILVDRITNPQQVDLLSPPLLLILLWNGVVYLWLLGWRLARVMHKPSRAPFQGAMAWRRKMAGQSKLPPVLGTAITQFASEWLRLSTPLNLARLSRAFHMSAALFAVGAIGSLALRGLFTQYRAGWESTFLGAEQVHALLQWLFAPAIAVFSLSGFSLADVQALRDAPSASPDTGAQWVMLYGTTLVLWVVLPRLALAMLAWLAERRLSQRLAIDLTQPYFRKLTAGLGDATPAWVAVFPYSFAVDEAHQQGLRRVAQSMLGDSAQINCQATTAYGDDAPGAPPDAADSPAALTVALFNLSATPERENHGEFLDQLSSAGGAKLALWVDESNYRDRVGLQAGGADRVAQRIALWRQFGELHHLPVEIVNLLHPGRAPSPPKTRPAHAPPSP